MGGNLYKNWGPEQRKHWNDYNREYAKKHFRTINLKLRFDEDKDIIDYINSHKGISLSQLVRDAIRQLIKKGK